MKFFDFEIMSLKDRRQFLKTLGTLMALPFTPEHVREAVSEILFGGKSYAQSFPTNQATHFIEICLRDQFDLGHIFVPPGVATYPNLIRGPIGNQVALFDDPNTLLKTGNNFYLTQEGRALQSHLDNIAVIDTCELGIGVIHTHEASNALRSPGRSFTAGANRPAMWYLDPADGMGGNQEHYSSTPTPAVLHNYYQKQLNPSQRNAVCYKGVTRPEHTIYHHSANLTNAQPDRFQSTASLLTAFAGLTQTNPTLLSQHGKTITQLLNQIDQKYLTELKYSLNAQTNHTQQLTGLGDALSKKASVTPFNLALNATEISLWQNGVIADPRIPNPPKALLWEQMAYATKLINNNLVKTVCLEYCYVDVHGSRNEQVLRTQSSQLVYPLATMIKQLKESGKFDQTLIAIYTADGSRSPASDSYGTNSKNSIMLVGGRIKGGYYGDVRIAGLYGGGHSFSYHKPLESTGVTVNEGNLEGGGRIQGASVWKTVAKAQGLPESLYNSYADVTGAPYLNFLLRS